MTAKLHIYIYFLFIPYFFFGQTQEVVPPDYIKTIIFSGETPESQLPIIKLGDRIALTFDALNGNEEDFYYKIEHYNYDWTPSNLTKAEYMNGYDNQRIRNYDNSFNTYQIYSHYNLIIPNDRTRGLKKSGNYMIHIYNDYDEIVFSRKFMLYENSANVGVFITKSRDVKYLEEKQSVDIKINSSSILFNNPSETVKTLIIQNNNLNTAISNVKPQYTLGNELIYKYTTETSFWGGNEYFSFENKDVKGANVAIEYISLEDLYNNFLFTNIVRQGRPYTYNPDINGNFVITALYVEKPWIEADYVWVHFSLLPSDDILNKSIYVYGNYNNYELTEANKMQFNDARGVYEAQLLLKQGFYSYKYVLVDDNNQLQEGAISGNHDETENNYKVLVYYRDLGARYDRLIGVGESNSIDITD
ncbi:DUF5103 domain-containing protein [Xanthomarina sp. F2636L]|uniref:type IX secretion system plug protein n=1 Tax=Xanthomarina sp. F2636L TaxID=2996018 RepID=UPI00225E574C|nr:DUF5103 domain-containing protein [Xanthomarina sp. F2636L]MCX7550812.1 DUF5103 domain-containing protein [Xanthomarina sp. F2636L]